jgi:hypothetical protein
LLNEFGKWKIGIITTPIPVEDGRSSWRHGSSRKASA